MSSICRVLIFGAGSSVHAGGPLAKDIYNRMESCFASEDSFSFIRELKEKFPEAFTNIEYLLTMLDLGSAKKISSFPGFSLDQICKIGDTLVKYLVELLSPNEVYDRSKITQRFFAKFLREGDVILTFGNTSMSLGGDHRSG